MMEKEEKIMKSKKVIRITELKLKLNHTQEALAASIERQLHLKPGAFTYEIMRQSIDARKKPELYYVYTVDVSVQRPESLAKRMHGAKASLVERKDYEFPYSRQNNPEFALYNKEETAQPVVVGSGPAGLFCALMLARAGLCPIVLERGEPVEQRMEIVQTFWESGRLDPNTNVQFGEGGAGTFSDGKLNTLIKDPDGKIRAVLNEFVHAGADPAIRYQQKPHIGTDVLAQIVKVIRTEIIGLGGTFRFGACLTRISRTEESSKSGRYLLELNGGAEVLAADQVVLAIGHSARDTCRMLYEFGMQMQPKAFAVGLRMEHPQAMINEAMYGDASPDLLGAAPYKVTHKCEDGRGVYSFCMCPGGYVVNASSEEGRLAVNGMSYSDRAGQNANSAIVVTVTPEDYHAGSPLDGIAFQRELEEAAYRCGDGKIPVQRFGDFCHGNTDLHRGDSSTEAIVPQMRGAFRYADVRSVLPEPLNEAIIKGIHAFGRRIPGFDREDALLPAVESRTSSPVRILRDGACQSVTHPGIYPCGEGAGYAGGITSAAVDGIRVAEAVCAAIQEQRNSQL